VSSKGAIKAGNIPVDTIIQIDKCKKIDSDILDKPFLKADEFQQLGELLLSYNEYQKTVPILGWIAGCFIKSHLRESETKYPHLFFTGEGGSGKSETMERIALPIFSCKKIKSASMVTGFSLMNGSSSSNLIPQFINEFKPSTSDPKKLNILLNHFRDAYDHHEGERGKSDLTTNTYELLAPILVAGEQSPSEAAIRERTIELLFSKKDINDSEQKERFVKLAKNKHLLESLGRTLLDVALQTSTEEVNAWYAEGEQRFSDDFQSRITTNLSCVYAGLRLVEKMCRLFKLDWNDVFPIDFETCVKHLVYSVKEYLLDGGTHSKSVIEDTFEVMARMGLKYDKDYIMRLNGKQLCLRLKNIYDRFTRYRKEHAILGEVLRYADFRRQLEKSEYFISNEDVMKFDGRSVRVWTLDYEKLKAVCDVEGFYESDSGEEK
jgi:hypothetical protein